MTLLGLFFLLSIAFSFLCSILEAVLLSVTPSYIRKAVNEKGATGRLLQAYKRDIDRPLSAILTLNTIAHTVGAIGVGAQAGALFGTKEINLGITSLSYESVIAGKMTLAILILSEIIPKTIGANNWKSLVPITIQILRVLLFLLAPFVWVSQLITRTFKKDKDGSVLSRSDFAAMAKEGATSGALNTQESTIIKNVLSFEQLKVRDIMTPKTVALMAEESTILKEFYESQKPIRFSRIPVYRGEKDEITGIILKDELLQQIVANKGTDMLSSIKRPVKTVSIDTFLLDLFKQLSKERNHLSIAVDEFGHVVGIVTLEDLFETLLGLEIVDEYDNVIDMQQHARKKWKKKSK